jgi:hypothetical protein
MSKEAYYFSHDANARQDEKILMLRAEHGWEGYGIYWALVEMMFENTDTALHHNKIKGISVSYNIAITLLESVINTCITEELFVSDGVKFWSDTLRRRKEKFKDAKEKRSAAGKKGMEKRWGKTALNKDSDNNVITKDNNVNNGVITKNNKGKEIKENKIKENDINNISAIATAFDDFWSAYPRKLDKKKAFEKFKSAAKNHDPQIIIQGAMNYAKQCEAQQTEKNFIKHPTTFLNAESFLNDFDTSYSKGGQVRTGVVKKSLFEQGPESRARQAEAEARASDKEIDWEKELEDLPY